ncbi:TPA: HNH endonuclease, partial [Aeromonas veronii]
MIQSLRNLKPLLLDKFNHQCAYCGTKLYDPLMADIEHFYPKSLYPHLLEESDNILIACRACNMIKANKFPIGDNGNPLLLNPL